MKKSVSHGLISRDLQGKTRGENTARERCHTVTGSKVEVRKNVGGGLGSESTNDIAHVTHSRAGANYQTG